MPRKKNKVAKEDIFQILFDRVIDGYYKPGFRLTEQMFATEFGTSRTPIREVLYQLSKLRLVKIHPNKGAEVLGLSCDDVEEMYDIRKSLELLALESAIPNIRLQELSELRAMVEGVTKETDLKVVAEIDRRIHEYIAEYSRRPRLKEMLEQLFLLIIRHAAFPEPEEVERTRTEHLGLINALFLRDLQKARSILEEHLENSKAVALSFIFSKGRKTAP
jgi:DNA-binding GntR family transcriptional regulator